MSQLMAIHKAQEEIPETYRDLYTERNGQWELTGIQGIKTAADFERQQAGLTKERDDHKATKDLLAPWTALGKSIEDVQSILDRLPELEAAASGNGIDEDKMNELVEGKVRTRLAPVERENEGLKKTVGELQESIAEYQRKDTQRTIADAVREVLVEQKVIDTAHEDVLMLANSMFEVTEDGAVITRDNVGVTPGSSPKDWLAEMQPKRPHWWPASSGGGAGGGGGGGGGANNPWTKDHWSVTAQGAYVRQHGQEKAEAMAKAAGSHIGAVAPPVK